MQTKKVAFLLGTLLTGGVLAQSLALADPVPVNTVNTSQIIKSGSYENTQNHYTVFSNANGLWLQKGSVINGYEVNSSGQQTGNGGSVWLSSPNGVVRVDGNINVQGAFSPIDATAGKGGNVKIDAAYLYQSGNIFATGKGNGGAVNINVNSATFAPGSTIDVSGGNFGSRVGGSITIKSNGVLDIQKGAAFVSNGINNGAVTSDVIDISAGLVNNSGIIRADGFSNTGSSGGVIRLTASGPIDLQPVANALYNTKVFTPCESVALFKSIHDLAAQFPAAIRNALINNGEVSADGAVGSAGSQHGGAGGSIVLQIINTMNNKPGSIHANGGAGTDGGGNGGSILSNSTVFQNEGSFLANGGDGTAKSGAFGGQGGSITILGPKFLNTTTGLFSANGGNGTADQGNGGNGGTVRLESGTPSADNQNFGTVLARGGNGSGGSTSKGGAAGHTPIIGIINEPGSVVDNSSGHN